MKRILYLSVVIGITYFFIQSGEYKKPSLPEVEKVDIEQKYGLSPEPVTPKDFGINFKGFDAFLSRLGHFESSNRYDIVNSLGYAGRYQFGRAALKDVGMGHISKKEFLANPELQDLAVRRLLKKNQKRLRRVIKKYDGTTYRGIRITESGILAAAHLGGAGNVKKFFRGGKNFKDAYGTSIGTYMIVFRNYDMSGLNEYGDRYYE